MSISENYRECDCANHLLLRKRYSGASLSTQANALVALLSIHLDGVSVKKNSRINEIRRQVHTFQFSDLDASEIRKIVLITQRQYSPHTTKRNIGLLRTIHRETLGLDETRLRWDGIGKLIEPLEGGMARILSEEEVGKLRLAISGTTESSAGDAMRRAALEVSLSSGIRVNNLSKLRIGNIDASGFLTYVADKTYMNAEHQLDESAIVAVVEMLKFRPNARKNDSLLVQVLKDGTVTNKPIGPWSIEKWWRGLSALADIPHFTHHSFRNSVPMFRLGSEVIEEINAIAKSFGHKNFASTMKHYITKDAPDRIPPRKILTILDA